jgi:hypothetical protein
MRVELMRVEVLIIAETRFRSSPPGVEHLDASLKIHIEEHGS